MGAEIINLETSQGAHLLVLQRIMRMVPDRDKDDPELKRLLAFRVMTDGENVTKEFLMEQIRAMIMSSYSGSLLHWLLNHDGAADDSG